MQVGPVLVLGATGSVGGGVARELLARGYPVKALVRDVGKAREMLGSPEGLSLVEGDVQDQAVLRQAAAGCAVIVHGVNYPYHQWHPRMETATANVIDVAQEASALILFPGNVYGLGPQTDRPLPESAPNLPTSRKSALRVALEDALKRATETGRARVLVLRAGDYFGPTVRNGLVDRIFGLAARGQPIQALGNLDVAHQWAFIPDLARAAVELLSIADRLPPFEVLHFAGYVVKRQRDFLRLVAQEAGYPGLKVRVLPWWLLRLIGWLDPQVREIQELRYLFDRSVILSGQRLQGLLPGYQDTPIAEAIALTLGSYRA